VPGRVNSDGLPSNYATSGDSVGTQPERRLLIYWSLGGFLVGIVASVVTGIPFLGFVGGLLGYFWGRYLIQKRRGDQ